MTHTIWVLATCLPGETKPCQPRVFATEAAALAAFRECMVAEWRDNGPDSPMPEDPFEAHDAIREWQDEESPDLIRGEGWGEWELTQHTIVLPVPGLDPGIAVKS